MAARGKSPTGGAGPARVGDGCATRPTSRDRRSAARLYARVEAVLDRTAGIDSVEALVDGCRPLTGEIVIREVPFAQWFDDPRSLVTGLAVLRDPPNPHLIVVGDDLAGVHRDHVVAHELAHLLSDHHFRSAVDGPPHTPLTCLRSPHFEGEAEAFADLVCTRVLAPAHVGDRSRFDWAR